jgi:2,3-bisphosphoglycerate-independent phosphoglycerate mutase
MAGSGIKPGDQSTYDEVSAESSGRRFDHGWDLMDAFIRR